MKQTIEDKLVSKVSKGKLNTIHVSREEMADLVDQHFIQNAETEEEYKQIWKVIKRGILFDKMIYTKDGNYQMRSCSSQGGHSLRRNIWIYDKTADTFYQYDYWYGFYGKFKKWCAVSCRKNRNNKNSDTPGYSSGSLNPLWFKLLYLKL